MNGDLRSFFDFVQVPLHKQHLIGETLSDEDWRYVLELAQRQAITGVAFGALEKLMSLEQRPPQPLLFEWIGLSEQIKHRNLLVNQRCKDLERLLSGGGFRCCVLKGQGTALYYENPLCRQSGDIDLWVTKDGRRKTDDVRDDILRFAKENDYHIGHVDIKHSDIGFFADVPVEIHFMPSWMFSPFTNNRLQRFFTKKADRQFDNYNESAGFTHTTVDFDLVFSLVHIYRHVFFEGIGLRQLLDYYHILLHSDKQQRNEAFMVLKELKMGQFAAGVMWVLKECFGLEEDYFLCSSNEKHGRFLLSEILQAGNFGHYDTRLKHQSQEKRLSNGLIQLKRNLRFLRYYPSEVLWSPIWKVWHWCWRKWKGYL